MAGEAGGKGAAVAKKTPSTPSGSASGGSGKSPAESKTPDPAASLSARLGGMVLMDKEVEGFIFDDPNPGVRKAHR